MARRWDTGRRRRGQPLLLLIALVLVGVAIWLVLRVGPAPEVTLTTSRPAIGRSTTVSVVFEAPAGGLGPVRLELEQGGRTEVLAQAEPAPARLGRPRAGGPGRLELEAAVGGTHQAWLEEGQAVLRAVAVRRSGPLRRPEPVVAEQAMPVLLRPPRLEVLSRQHYVRQGGSGVVVLRSSEGVARLGVRSGEVEAPAWDLPGAERGERFVLYPVPWDLTQPSEIRAFAEDDAGNRTEVAFLDLFKASPPGEGTIPLTEGFLEKVVPEILNRSEGIPASGSLLDQYLTINRELRQRNLAQVRAMSEQSVAQLLWRGAFVTLRGGARQASFADRRAYIWQGEVVDRQTHLGLDLASVAAAPVPAANHGRVLYAGWLGIYGNTVVLDHGHGLVSLYGHLSSLDVEEGEEIAQGETVGRTGATGLAGGDHLHFEIFVAGTSVSPIEWLDAHWIEDNIGTKIPLPESGTS